MSIVLLLFIGGIALKCLLILIKSSIERLNLKYKTNLTSSSINMELENVNLKKNIELKIESTSNPLKPLAKQIYMRVAS